MISGPTKWYTLAETLRLAIHAGLTVPPDRSGVVPGEIAWDACDCGLLAVAVQRIYLSDIFPNQQTTKISPCDAAWEVGEIVVQLLRCAPADPVPTVAALDASAQEVLLDAYELLKATSTKLCTLKRTDEIVDFFMSPLTSQGPSGTCVGNELRVLVALPRN